MAPRCQAIAESFFAALSRTVLDIDFCSYFAMAFMIIDETTPSRAPHFPWKFLYFGTKKDRAKQGPASDSEFSAKSIAQAPSLY